MNKNGRLSLWHEQLSRLYSFAARKNIDINLLKLIRIDVNTTIKQRFPNITYFNVDEWNLDYLRLPVGFVKIDKTYTPLYTGDIVYVDDIKYIITDKFFGNTICMASEFHTNSTEYLKFEDMVLNPCDVFIELNGTSIVRPRKISASQIKINYNNESVLYRYGSHWYEFASLEDKRLFLDYMATIFEEK